MKIYAYFIFLFFQLVPQEQQTVDTEPFIGLWHHAQGNRDIRIVVEETDSTRYTIYDSTRDIKGKLLGSEDIYPAFRKNDKLVMPASKSPRCPYCEIQRKEETLLYICNSPLDLESNILRPTEGTDTTLFKRKR